jgi:hypothetical protein
VIEFLLDQFGIAISGTAITLGAVALWIWRGRRIISLIGALFGSAITISISLLVSLAVAIALGWIEIHLGVMMSDIGSGVRWILRVPVDLIRSLLS